MYAEFQQMKNIFAKREREKHVSRNEILSLFSLHACHENVREVCLPYAE